MIKKNPKTNQSRPIRVAALTTSISRNAGGLFWSVRSFCNTLIQDGVEVKVFGGEDAHSQDDLSTWDQIPLVVLPISGPKAFGFQRGLLDTLNESQPDLLHIHGLWTYSSLAGLLWSNNQSPYIVSPHGMLDSWAVQNSALKKKFANLLYSNAFLRGASCIHALCNAERDAIRNYGLKNPIAVIPNGVDLPQNDAGIINPDWNTSLPTNSKALLSLSRLHPKKGLMNLINAWAKTIQSKAKGAEEWQLVVAGWDQGGHLSQLKNRTRELGIENSVHFIGPQFNTAKLASLFRADAFILPSFSEGLPMSVLEAWSCGLPVIMTPQCNLPEGFSADAAIRVAPEIDSLTEGLTTLFSMSDEDRKSQGERGRSLVQRDFLWPKIGVQMHEVYRWILGQGPKPDCVQLY